MCRLFTTKSADPEEDVTKLEKVMLKFDENGKEQWVPAKKVGLACVSLRGRCSCLFLLLALIDATNSSLGGL